MSVSDTLGDDVIDGPRFAQIPEWIVYADISAQAVRLYCTLHRHMPNIHPGMKRLAGLMRCSIDTVRRASDELQKVGALSITPRYRTEEGRERQQIPNRWTLAGETPFRVEGDAPTRPPPSTGATTPPSTGATTPLAPTRPKGEQEKENKNKEAGARQVSPNFKSSSSDSLALKEEKRTKAKSPSGRIDSRARARTAPVSTTLEAGFDAVWGEYPPLARDHRPESLVEYCELIQAGKNEAKILEAAILYEQVTRSWSGEAKPKALRWWLKYGEWENWTEEAIEAKFVAENERRALDSACAIVREVENEYDHVGAPSLTSAQMDALDRRDYDSPDYPY